MDLVGGAQGSSALVASLGYQAPLASETPGVALRLQESQGSDLLLQETQAEGIAARYLAATSGGSSTVVGDVFYTEHGTAYDLVLREPEPDPYSPRLTNEFFASGSISLSGTVTATSAVSAETLTFEIPGLKTSGVSTAAGSLGYGTPVAAGTVTGASSVTAQATRLHVSASQVAGAAASAASAAMRPSLTAVAQGQSSGAGSLTQDMYVASAVTASAEAAAAVRRVLLLQVFVAPQATAESALALQSRLLALAAGAGTVASSTTTLRRFSVTAAGEATATTALAVERTLRAVLLGSSLVTTDVRVTRDLTSAASGTGTVSATGVHPVQIEAVVSALASAVASTALTLRLQGAVAGASTASTTPFVLLRGLRSEVVSRATATGTERTEIALAASSVGAATAVTSARVLRALTVSASGAALVTASTSLTKRLTATASGTATTSSAVVLTKRIAALVGGAAVTSGAVNVTAVLAATSTGTGAGRARMARALATFYAAATGTAAASSSVQVRRPLVPVTISGSALVASVPVLVARGLTASVSGSAASTAFSHTVSAFVATVPGRASTAARVNLHRLVEASSAGTAAASAPLRATRTLVAVTSVGQASVADTPVLLTKRLSATAGGSATAASAVNVTAAFAAEVFGQTATASAVNVTAALAAEVSGRTLATAAVRVERTVTAASAGTATSSVPGILRSIPLASAVAGQATASTAAEVLRRLTASAAGHAAATSAIRVTAALSSSVTARTDVTASVQITATFTADAAGTATASTPLISRSVPFASTLSGSATVDTSVQVLRRITATSGGTATASTEAVVTRTLTATAAGRADAASAVNITAAFTATVSGQAAATSAVRVTRVLTTGGATGQAAVTSSVALTKRLTGQSSSAATASASTLTLTRRITATAVGTSAVASAARVTAALSSTVQAQASASAARIDRTFFLTTDTVTGTSSAETTVQVLRPLHALAEGTSSTTSAVRVTAVLSAEAAGQTTAASAVQVTAALTAQAHAQAVASAAVNVVATFTAEVQASASATSDAAVTRRVEAQAAGTATAASAVGLTLRLTGQADGVGTAGASFVLTSALSARASGQTQTTSAVQVTAALSASSSGTSTTTVPRIERAFFLDASASGAATSSASVLVAVFLASAADGASSAQAAVRVTAALTSTALASSSVVAEIVLTAALSSMVAAHAGTTASVNLTRPVDASSAGAATASTEAVVTRTLTAAATGLATTTSEVRRTQRLASTATASSTALASPFVLTREVDARSTGTSDASAFSQTTVALSAATAGLGYVVAYTDITRTVTAFSSGSAAVSVPEILRTIPLVSDVAGAASASAAPFVLLRRLTAGVTGFAATDAAFRVAATFTGSSEGAATTAASAQTTAALTGAAEGTAEATATDLRRAFYFDAEVTGSAQTQAAVRVTVALAARAAAASDAAAFVAVLRRLTTTARGTTEVTAISETQSALAASADAASTAQAETLAQISLAATATSQALAFAALQATRTLEAASDGASVVSTTLAVSRVLSAEAVGISDGALAVEVARALAVAVDGATTTEGTLQTEVAFAATVEGAATAAVAAPALSREVTASSDGQSQAAASVAVTSTYTADVTASGAVTAFITRTALSGESLDSAATAKMVPTLPFVADVIAAGSSVSADVTLTAVLAAVADGSTRVASAVGLDRLLAVDSTGSADVRAEISQTLLLAASAASAAGVSADVVLSTSLASTPDSSSTVTSALVTEVGLTAQVLGLALTSASVRVASAFTVAVEASGAVTAFITRTALSGESPDSVATATAEPFVLLRETTAEAAGVASVEALGSQVFSVTALVEGTAVVRVALGRVIPVAAAVSAMATTTATLRISRALTGRIDGRAALVGANLSFAARSEYSALVRADGARAYYLFDDATPFTAATTFQDRSQSSASYGALLPAQSSAVAVSQIEGPKGPTAVSVPSSDPAVTGVPLHWTRSGMGTTNAASTVEGWVRAPNGVDARTTLPIFSLQNWWALQYFDNTTIRFRRRVNGLAVTTAITVPDIRTSGWNHFAVVVEPRAATGATQPLVSVYRNGVLIVDRLGFDESTTSASFFFHRDMLGGGVSSCQYANVALYDKVLSRTQIQAHVNASPTTRAVGIEGQTSAGRATVSASVRRTAPLAAQSVGHSDAYLITYARDIYGRADGAATAEAAVRITAPLRSRATSAATVSISVAVTRSFAPTVIVGRAATALTAINVTREVTAAATGTGTVSATGVHPVQIEALVQGAADVTAATQVARRLRSQVAGQAAGVVEPFSLVRVVRSTVTGKAAVAGRSISLRTFVAAAAGRTINVAAATRVLRGLTPAGISGQAVVASSVQPRKGLVSRVAGTASVAGESISLRGFRAVVPAKATVTAATNIEAAFAATASGTSAGSARLARALATFYASATGFSAASTDLRPRRGLDSSVTGSASVDLVPVLVLRRLVATATGRAEVSGSTRVTATFAAESTGSATAVVPLIERSFYLTADTVTGTSAASTALRVTRSLVAVLSVGSSTATSAIRLATAFVGQTSGRATAESSAVVTAALRAQTTGSATAASAVQVTATFTAESTGTSAATTAVRVTRALTADATGSSSAEVPGILRRVPFAATVASAAEVTAAARVTSALAASASGAAATSGYVDLTKTLTADASGAATVSAPLDLHRLVTASSTGSATTRTVVRVERTLTAESTGTSEVASVPVYVLRRLTALVEGASTATSAVEVTTSLTALVEGMASTDSAVRITAALTGESAGQAEVSVPLILRSFFLDATSDAVAAASAVLDATRTVTADVSGAATTSGYVDLTKTLTAVTAGASTVESSINVTATLTAEVTGLADATGAANITAAFAADAVGAAEALAVLDLTKTVTAEAAGVSEVTGTVEVTTSLVGLAEGAAEVAVAPVEVTRTLTAAVDGAAETSASVNITATFTAEVAGQATAEVPLVYRSFFLDAASDGAGAVESSVAVITALDGASAGLAEVTGSVEVTTSLSALSQALSAVSASAVLTVDLVGSSAGLAETTARVNIGSTYTAHADGLAAASGAVENTVSYAVVSVGSATVVPAVEVTTDLAAEVTGQAVVGAAAIRVERALTVEVAGEATVVSTGRTRSAFLTAVAGQAAATGAVDLTLRLRGQSVGRAGSDTYLSAEWTLSADSVGVAKSIGLVDIQNILMAGKSTVTGRSAGTTSLASASAGVATATSPFHPHRGIRAAAAGVGTFTVTTFVRLSRLRSTVAGRATALVEPFFLVRVLEAMVPGRAAVSARVDLAREITAVSTGRAHNYAQSLFPAPLEAQPISGATRIAANLYTYDRVRAGQFSPVAVNHATKPLGYWRFDDVPFASPYKPYARLDPLDTTPPYTSALGGLSLTATDAAKPGPKGPFAARITSRGGHAFGPRTVWTVGGYFKMPDAGALTNTQYAPVIGGSGWSFFLYRRYEDSLLYYGLSFKKSDGSTQTITAQVTAAQATGWRWFYLAVDGTTLRSSLGNATSVAISPSFDFRNGDTVSLPQFVTSVSSRFDHYLGQMVYTYTYGSYSQVLQPVDAANPIVYPFASTDGLLFLQNAAPDTGWHYAYGSSVGRAAVPVARLGYKYNLSDTRSDGASTAYLITYAVPLYSTDTAGVAATEASVNLRSALRSRVAGASAVTEAWSRVRYFASRSTGAATVKATLNAHWQVAAVSDASASVRATGVHPVQVEAQSVGAATTSAAVRLTLRIRSRATGVASAATAVEVARRLRSTVTGRATVAVPRMFALRGLTAFVTGLATVSPPRVIFFRTLDATAAGQTAVVPVLRTRLVLRSQATARAAVTAAVGRIIPVRSTVAAVAKAVAVANVEWALAATAAGTSAGSARMSRRLAASGYVEGASTARAVPTYLRLLVSQAAGQAAASAEVVRTVRLVSRVTGRAASAAAVARARSLLTVAGGTATGRAVVRRRAALVSQVSGTASILATVTRTALSGASRDAHSGANYGSLLFGREFQVRVNGRATVPAPYLGGTVKATAVSGGRASVAVPTVRYFSRSLLGTSRGVAWANHKSPEKGSPVRIAGSAATTRAFMNYRTNIYARSNGVARHRVTRLGGSEYLSGRSDGRCFRLEERTGYREESYYSHTVYLWSGPYDVYKTRTVAYTYYVEVAGVQGDFEIKFKGSPVRIDGRATANQKSPPKYMVAVSTGRSSNNQMLPPSMVRGLRVRSSGLTTVGRPYLGQSTYIAGRSAGLSAANKGALNFGVRGVVGRSSGVAFANHTSPPKGSPVRITGSASVTRAYANFRTNIYSRPAGRSTVPPAYLGQSTYLSGRSDGRSFRIETRQGSYEASYQEEYYIWYFFGPYYRTRYYTVYYDYDVEVAGVQGDLRVRSAKTFQSRADGRSTIKVNLNARWRLRGSSAGVRTVTGSLRVFEKATMFGDIGGVSATVVQSPVLEQTLSAEAAGASFWVANMDRVVSRFAGLSAGRSGETVPVGDGTFVERQGVFGFFTFDYAVAAQSDGQAGAATYLGQAHAVTAASVGTSTNQSNIGSPIPLAVEIAGLAGVAPALRTFEQVALGGWAASEARVLVDYLGRILPGFESQADGQAAVTAATEAIRFIELAARSDGATVYVDPELEALGLPPGPGVFGYLGIIHPVASQISGHSTVVATAGRGPGLVAVTVHGIGSATDAYLVSPVRFEVVSTGQTSVTGQPRALFVLAAEVTGQAVVPDSRLVEQLAANVTDAASQVQAEAAMVIALRSWADGLAEATATAAHVFGMYGTPTGEATVEQRGYHNLAVVADGTSAARVNYLGVPRPLEARSDGQAVVAVPTLGYARPLVAVVDASAAVAVEVYRIFRLQAVAAAVSTLAADLAITSQLLALADGTATAEQESRKFLAVRANGTSAAVSAVAQSHGVAGRSDGRSWRWRYETYTYESVEYVEYTPGPNDHVVGSGPFYKQVVTTETVTYLVEEAGVQGDLYVRLGIRLTGRVDGTSTAEQESRKFLVARASGAATAFATDLNFSRGLSSVVKGLADVQPYIATPVRLEARSDGRCDWTETVTETYTVEGGYWNIWYGEPRWVSLWVGLIWHTPRYGRWVKTTTTHTRTYEVHHQGVKGDLYVRLGIRLSSQVDGRTHIPDPNLGTPMRMAAVVRAEATAEQESRKFVVGRADGRTTFAVGTFTRERGLVGRSRGRTVGRIAIPGGFADGPGVVGTLRVLPHRMVSDISARATVAAEAAVARIEIHGAARVEAESDINTLHRLSAVSGGAATAVQDPRRLLESLVLAWAYTTVFPPQVVYSLAAEVAGEATVTPEPTDLRVSIDGEALVKPRLGFRQWLTSEEVIGRATVRVEGFSVLSGRADGKAQAGQSVNEVWLTEEILLVGESSLVTDVRTPAPVDSDFSIQIVAKARLYEGSPEEPPPGVERVAVEIVATSDLIADSVVDETGYDPGVRSAEDLYLDFTTLTATATLDTDKISQDPRHDKIRLTAESGLRWRADTVKAEVVLVANTNLTVSSARSALVWFESRTSMTLATPREVNFARVAMRARSMFIDWTGSDIESVQNYFQGPDEPFPEPYDPNDVIYRAREAALRGAGTGEGYRFDLLSLDPLPVIVGSASRARDIQAHRPRIQTVVYGVPPYPYINEDQWRPALMDVDAGWFRTEFSRMGGYQTHHYVDDAAGYLLAPGRQPDWKHSYDKYSGQPQPPLDRPGAAASDEVSTEEGEV